MKEVSENDLKMIDEIEALKSQVNEITRQMRELNAPEGPEHLALWDDRQVLIVKYLTLEQELKTTLRK